MKPYKHFRLGRTNQTAMFNWVSNLLPSYQEGHTGPTDPIFTGWNNVSNFQKVLDFNTQFGVVQNKTLTPKSNYF